MNKQKSNSTVVYNPTGRMKKLIIAGRTNWIDGFYTKFKAKKDSMKIIKKIAEAMSSNYFANNEITLSVSNYSKWKDKWIHLVFKKVKIDIICGDKYIHMFITNCSSYKIINSILDKYCEWVKVKQR